MNNPALQKLTRNGKALFLAYDQGFEHGPTDFNQENVNPKYILNIAQKAGVYTAVIFQKGIAQKYYPIGGLDHQSTPPLLVKLNGKTAFHKGEEPYSPQLCSVEEAAGLGAAAVGYTIYVGSEHEAKMMQEFSLIEKEAHEKGLAVTLWAYPRGAHVEGKETSRDTVAYAARLSLELGADFVKLPYTGDPESFSWVVKSAGNVKVLVQGGSKKSEEELFAEISGFMSAGASGMAIGRNIWQADDPVTLSKRIAELIF